LSYIYYESEPGRRSGKVTVTARGAADCGEYRERAGVTEKALTTMRNPMRVYFSPLGEVIVYFNLLEHDLRFAIWRLSGVNEHHRSEIIVGHIQSFKRQITLFQQLANLNFSDARTRTRVKKLTKRMHDINARRNDLIHGTWKSFDPKGAFIIRFQAQLEKANWRPIKKSPSTIHSEAKKIWRTSISLRRFIANIEPRCTQKAKSRGRS
jgi:hypothetical protein